MCDKAINDGVPLNECYSADSTSLHYTTKNNIQQDAFGSFTDVGTDIYVKVKKIPGIGMGLTILNEQHIYPSWPIILNIKMKSPAAVAQPQLVIGDRIKEIDGIPTNHLLHSEVIALFHKASDEMTMTVRRVLKTNDKSFHWYRFPFSCVSQRCEKVVLKNPRYCQTVLNDGDTSFLDRHFTTFKGVSCKEINKTSSVNSLAYYQSFSMYSIYNSFLTEEEKKLKGADALYTHKNLSYDRLYHRNLNCFSDQRGKFIADEVYDRFVTENSPNQDFEGSLSSGSVSSLRSVSAEEVSEKYKLLKKKSVPSFPTSDIGIKEDRKSRKNVSFLSSNMRNYLWRRKSKEEDGISNGKTVLHYDSGNNTFLHTIWVADIKSLGIKFGGGSISPYGNTNISVTELVTNREETCIFKENDQIIEVNGVETFGMNTKDIKKLIKNLEGSFIEFKIFRPV